MARIAEGALALARERGLREALAALVSVRLHEGGELRGVEAGARRHEAVPGIGRRALVRRSVPGGQGDPAPERGERRDEQAVRVLQVPGLDLRDRRLRDLAAVLDSDAPVLEVVDDHDL